MKRLPASRLKPWRVIHPGGLLKPVAPGAPYRADPQLLEMLPGGMGQMASDRPATPAAVKMTEAIINSMTPGDDATPDPQRQPSATMSRLRHRCPGRQPRSNNTRRRNASLNTEEIWHAWDAAHVRLMTGCPRPAG
jgi:hypothetical protein